MQPSENLLHLPIEKLVDEIVAVNHAWKETKDLLGDHCALTTSLRQTKDWLQVRLLKQHSDWAFLQFDPHAVSDEPLYGLQLVKPINGRTNAEHIPVRVAQEVLSASELSRFVRE